MKKRLKEILNSLPPQPPRSRLEPYSELIEAMRARNWTYRGIARVLAEKCGVQVSPSNLHHFVKHHLLTNVRAKDKSSAIESALHGTWPNAPPEPTVDISRLRDNIEHQSQSPLREGDVFEFDPTVPLRLMKRQ